MAAPPDNTKVPPTPLPTKPVRPPFSVSLGLAIVLGLGCLGMLILWQLAEGRYQAEASKAEALAREAEAKKKTQTGEQKIVPVPNEQRPLGDGQDLQTAARDGYWAFLKTRLGRQPEAERGWEWHYFQHLLKQDGYLLTSHLRRQTALAFRPPDGKQAASGCVNGLVVLWDAEAPEGTRPRQFIGLEGPVTALAFSHDGRVLAAGGEAGALLAWKVDDIMAKPLVLKGHQDRIDALTFDPKGHVLASAAGTDVRFWNLSPDAAVDKKDAKDPGPELTVLPPQAASIHDLAFSPDGDKIYAACHDHKIRLWNWLEQKETTPPLEMKHWVTCLGPSADGKHIAAASVDGVVKIWDAATGKDHMTLENAPGPLRALAYSGDKKRLSALTKDQTILVWDLTNQKLIKKLPAQEGRLRGPWLSLNGDLFPVINTPGTEIDLDRRLAPTPLLGVAFGPKDQELGAIGVDGTLFLWDTQGKDRQDTLKSSIKAHLGAVRGIAFCPSLSQWATGGEDGQIGLWEFGKTENILRDPTKAAVNALAYHARGQTLAAAGPDQIRLWDLKKNTPQIDLVGGHKGQVLAVAQSPGGELVASGGADQSILLWNPDKAEIIHAWKNAHPGGVLALAFSPRGKLLASAGRDRVIRLWDLDTKRELLTCSGHAQAINCLAFSPDGLRLASGSDDRAVKLWDPGAGQEVLTLLGHQQPVTGLTFSGDGKGLASVSWDQSLIVWTPPSSSRPK